MRRILMLIAFCTWTVSACAQESGLAYEEGVHYTKVTAEPAPRGKVEVIEFFSYTCPHCAAFAPYIHKWEKKQQANVKVTYIPVVFHETLLNYAKAHYALEILGVGDKGRALIFEAIHVKNEPLDTPEKIADLMATIGVNKKKLLETMDSFAVDNSVRLGLQRTQKYRISGVPAVAINGKYLTNVGMGGGDEGVLKVMDYLVQLETKNKAKPAAKKAEQAPAAAATSASAAGSK